MAAGDVLALWATHVVLPLLFCLWLWRGTPASRTEWLAEASAYGTYIVFVTLAGTWVQIGLVLRYLAPAVYAFVIWRIGRVRWALPVRDPSATRATRVRQVFFAFMAAAFLLMNLVCLRGFYHPRELAVELTFPLEAGLYGVTHGGSQPFLNRYAAESERRFAVELVGLGPWRSSSSKVFPGRLEDFHIWGALVRSPCAGEVVAVEAGGTEAVDRAVDSVETNGSDVSGDGGFVRIRTFDQDSVAVDVVLSHLQEGSITVSPGDSLSVGDAVGRVGASDGRTEPTLLVHAATAVRDARTSGSGAAAGTATPRPLHFAGAFLVRNTQYRSR